MRIEQTKREWVVSICVIGLFVALVFFVGFLAGSSHTRERLGDALKGEKPVVAGEMPPSGGQVVSRKLPGMNRDGAGRVGESHEARGARGSSVKKLIDLRKTGKHRPAFSLLDGDGLLTSQAIQAASLSPGQVAIVQEETDALMHSLGLGVKRATKEEPRLSIDGEPAYRIQPFEDEASASVETYLDALSEGVGNDEAWLLAKSLPLEVLAGGAGTCEVVFRIFEPDSEIVEGLSPEHIKEFYRIEYEYRNPETGKVVSGGLCGWRPFNDQFLGILE